MWNSECSEPPGPHGRPGPQEPGPLVPSRSWCSARQSVGCQSAERAGDWQCFLIECMIQHECIYDNTIKFIHRWIFFFVIWVTSGSLVPRTFVSKYFFQWDIRLSQITLSSLWKLEIGPQAGRICCEVFIPGRPVPQFYPRVVTRSCLVGPLSTEITRCLHADSQTQMHPGGRHP